MSRNVKAWRWLWAGAVLLALGMAPAGCGPRSMRARMEAGERASDRAVSALDDGEKALARGDLDRAESRVKDAERDLSDPDVMTNPESDLLKTRLTELKVKIPEVRKKREAEELAKKVAARREAVSRAVTQYRKAAAEMEEKPGDRGAMNAARDAAKKVRDEVEWDKQLAERDAELKGYLDGIRQDLQEGEKALVLAEKVMELVEGPVKARDAAAAGMAKAKEEKNPDEKVKLLSAAQEGYARCAADAEKAIAATPGLEKANVLVTPKPATSAAVAKECKQQVESSGKLLATAKKAAEVAAKKAEVARLKAEAAAKKAEAARLKAEAAAKKKAEAEAKKAAAREKKQAKR